MVPRYALRKLSLFPPPVRTHAPHTERDERRAAARANGVDAGATPPPGIRRKRPRRSAPAAAPRTAPNGVEHFRDLHSIWSAEGSQGKKRPRRIGRVRPRSSRQSLPRAGRSARVGCRANPRGEASPATCKRTVECREGVGASGRGGPWRGAGEWLAERRHLASARGRTSLTIHRVSAPVDRLCRAANHGVTAANTYRLAGGARRLYYILWAARGPQLTSSPCARSAGRLNGGTRARWPQKTRAHAARADVAAVEA